jgi:hypothetical protein
VGLIQLVMILLAVGAVIWLVEMAPFISATMKPIIRWVILAIVVLWLISIFVGDIPIIPRR